jgi:glutamate racemase
VVRPLIEPLVAAGVDTLVLGCTHYPFLKPAIRAIVGDALTLIDSGEAIARRAEFVLDLEANRTERTIPGGIELKTTGDVDHVSRIASRLLSDSLKAQSFAFPRDDQSAAFDLLASTSACTDSVSAGA